MKIPKTVKVGGNIYTIEVTDNLNLGSSTVTGEIDYENLKIRLVPYTCEAKKQADFMHELIHAMAYNLGYRLHDEKEIDAFAQLLYAVIKDNPEVFKD